MKKIIQSLAVISFLGFCQCDPVAVTPCDGITTSRVKLSNIDVSNLFIGENASISYQISSSIALKQPRLEISLRNSGYDVDCDPEAKSQVCTFSLCNARDPRGQMACQSWGCQCPIRPSTYKNRFEIPIPTLNSFLTLIVTSSDTAIKLRLKDGPTTEFCGTFKIRVKAKDQQKNLVSLFGRRPCLPILDDDLGDADQINDDYPESEEIFL